MDEDQVQVPKEIGWDPRTGYKLFHLHLASASQLCEIAPLSSRHFVCLLAWDAVDEDRPLIGKITEMLVIAGCASIACWGSNCELVHDYFDEAEIAHFLEGPYRMSTWHRNESLADALWYALTLAPQMIEDEEFPDCQTFLAISIANPGWEQVIANALGDPAAFEERLLQSE